MSATAASFPRLPLFTTMAVLAGALLCAGAARLTGFATPAAPPAIIATTTLNFTDLADGGVAVRDAGTGRLVTTIAARDDGFLRMSLRILAGYRARESIGPEKPFRLTALQGGRLQLTDTATGQLIELDAFGPSNVGEYVTLLAAAEHKS